MIHDGIKKLVQYGVETGLCQINFLDYNIFTEGIQ